ncbi:hypothetical protein BUALT_Bualt05G0005100 [Buddleja alternifolia]|uniref:DEAD-box RNA helicase Q domain-containing protein n=1 Tax=Buddleja alternifolia TaxID=168488 RepID=A0AAV6XMG3_9LAMI|nr:hypothetical protein BUALT_Bualt05G0005100 [Buddleja alternifolia]
MPICITLSRSSLSTLPLDKNSFFPLFPNIFLSAEFCETLIQTSPIISIRSNRQVKMGDNKENDAYEEELLDYEEEDEKAPDSVGAKVNGESVKKGYVGIHSSGFRDFLLKPELLRAIVDSGFEHPSEGNILL